MLRRYSEVFRSILLIADLSLVAASWLAAYAIRFHSGLPVPQGSPPLAPYIEALLLIVPLFFFLFRAQGLYEPHRTRTIPSEAAEVLRATFMGVVVLVTISFFTRSYFYSRGVAALFLLLSSGSVWGLRAVLRLGFRELRRRGYNLRYVVVVGAGELAAQVIERIHASPETGLVVRVAIAGDESGAPSFLAGVPVVRGYSVLREVLARDRVDQVVLALPREQSDHLEKILADLESEFVSLKLVPDLLHVMTFKSSVDDLDGLPMVALRESPYLGWAAVGKRAFDLAVSCAVLPIALPVGLGIALAVRVASGRPVFYSQQRVGLDGRVFRMFKFRTMVPDAESGSGPMWTTPNDPRRTKLGAILRRRGLDELPQLWNVLRGEMSLVGPRPERPHFIEQFRAQVPGYMLRQKVKSGITGWAQLQGWRGDTSLRERIEHDLYYVQNWSIGFDIRILSRTLWRLWRQRNAY